MAILPMVDSLVVLEITGKQLLEALENGVSQYPKLEGRFPQVSGLTFTFDSTQPSGERVLSDTVKIKGESLDVEKVQTDPLLIKPLPLKCPHIYVYVH